MSKFPLKEESEYTPTSNDYSKESILLITDKMSWALTYSSDETEKGHKDPEDH